MGALIQAACHERRQPRAVGGRMLLGQAIERSGVGEQTLAPVLGGRHASLLGHSRLAPSRELRFDRRRIDLAHKAADELQLPSTRLALCQPPRCLDGFAKFIRQRQYPQSVGPDLNQAFPQILESVHGLLTLRLGNRRCGTLTRGRGPLPTCASRPRSPQCLLSRRPGCFVG